MVGALAERGVMMAHDLRVRVNHKERRERIELPLGSLCPLRLEIVVLSKRP